MSNLGYSSGGYNSGVQSWDPTSGNQFGTDFDPNNAFQADSGGYLGESVGTGASGGFMAAGMFTQMFATIAGGISQRNAIEAQSQYKIQQLNFNAQMADLQAQAAIDDGNRAAEKVETAGNQAVGEERASAGAQGIEVNAGSAADIQESSKTMSLLDALTIKNNAVRQAFGYKVQGISDRGEAGFTEVTAKSQENATLLTSGLTALGQGSMGYYYGSGGTIKDSTHAL